VFVEVHLEHSNGSQKSNAEAKYSRTNLARTRNLDGTRLATRRGRPNGSHRSKCCGRIGICGGRLRDNRLGRGGHNANLARVAGLEADLGHRHGLGIDRGGRGSLDGGAVRAAGDNIGDGCDDGGVDSSRRRGRRGDDLGDGLGTCNDGGILGRVRGADALEEENGLANDDISLAVGVDAGEDVLHECHVGTVATSVGVVEAGDGEHPGVQARGNDIRAGQLRKLGRGLGLLRRVRRLGLLGGSGVVVRLVVGLFGRRSLDIGGGLGMC
jgi:hypothetical protein